MPPRPRRETPERQSRRIRKHVAQAKQYWANGTQHLLEQDTCQAAEKGWGTVAQLGNAVATLRSWDHYDHDAVRDCFYALAEEAPDRYREIVRGVRAAEHLHGHFYEVYMTLKTVELALEDVTPLLEILWELLPDDYTGGRTFTQSIAA